MRSEREQLGYNEEVDFMDLMRGLWKQKFLLVVTTLLTTLAAVIYAFMATPVYEARLFVKPPTQNDISQLNVGRNGEGERVTAKGVYESYLQNLQSELQRRAFFRDIYLPSLNEQARKGSQDELYSEFGKALQVRMVGPDAPNRYYVAVRATDPQLAATWAEKYVQTASDRAKRELIADAKADALIKAGNLKQSIFASRESARKQREDQIALLTEALKVARSVGLEKPPIISNTLSNEVSAGMDGALVYMRGSKALEAEIANLRSRTSDDPFITDLRSREEALTFYSNLEIKDSVFEVYRQDGGVEAPDRPIKPNKLLIIALGVIGGLFIGVVIAVMRGLTTRSKA